jgi:hypothetical protein
VRSGGESSRLDESSLSDEPVDMLKASLVRLCGCECSRSTLTRCTSFPETCGAGLHGILTGTQPSPAALATGSPTWDRFCIESAIA